HRPSLWHHTGDHRPDPAPRAGAAGPDAAGPDAAQRSAGPVPVHDPRRRWARHLPSGLTRSRPRFAVTVAAKRGRERSLTLTVNDAALGHRQQDIAGALVA